MHNWNPEDYEKSSSAQYNWAIGLISKLDLRGDERILDIGCGDGKITSGIASLVPNGSVLGIDISQGMIEFAKDKYTRDKCRNLSFQLVDASSLDYKEEFDLVVSFACLHWIKDHLSVLRGVRRSLKPGGKIIFQCGGSGNASKILNIAEGMIRSERWSKYFQGFTFPYYFYGPEEYGTWLYQAGLRALRVELLSKDMVHTKAGLEGWIRTTWLPYIERIPEDMRQVFLGEVADIYIERYPLDADRMVHVQMMRLEVEAEK
ncbi:MAG: methyltransferase domain-containing protein [Methanotrichaceae archaeon]